MCKDSFNFHKKFINVDDNKNSILHNFWMRKVII